MIRSRIIPPLRGVRGVFCLYYQELHPPKSPLKGGLYRIFQRTFYCRAPNDSVLIPYRIIFSLGPSTPLPLEPFFSKCLLVLKLSQQGGNFIPGLIALYNLTHVLHHRYKQSVQLRIGQPFRGACWFEILHGQNFHRFPVRF